MWYDKLEEKKVWQYFQEISEIPRESGNEEGVRQYLLAWAKKRNIEVTTDKIGNVIMFKEGAKGKEPICLQGHMDMVCVKREGSNHDFTKDPIEIVLDGNYIRAKDTSLGADNGVAVAFALALLEEDDPERPSLEALFTVCEESKLLGANNVEADKIRSRKLLNIDSEEEGIIYIGCAGGLQIIAEKKVKYKEVEKNSVHLKLSISGLLGGHSGGEIHKERANANKLLARIMHRFPIYSLTDIQGGTRSNVIPSSAYARYFLRLSILFSATFCLSASACFSAFKASASTFNSLIQQATFSSLASLSICNLSNCSVSIISPVSRSTHSIIALSISKIVILLFLR